MEKHIQFIEEVLNNFSGYERKRSFAKKQSNRDSEYSNIENQILILENYLNKNDEVHHLFMGFFEGFSYEEALSVRYFSRDLSRFLGHLKK